MTFIDAAAALGTSEKVVKMNAIECDGTLDYNERIVVEESGAARAKRERKNRAARERSQMMRDLGLRRNRDGSWE